jgi:hypothetical protein
MFSRSRKSQCFVSLCGWLTPLIILSGAYLAVGQQRNVNPEAGTSKQRPAPKQPAPAAGATNQKGTAEGSAARGNQPQGVAAAGAGVRQPVQNGRTANQAREEAEFLQSSLIVGVPLTLQGGATFGNVDDFIIGPNGCVQFLIVSNGNASIAIPWNAMTFDATNGGLFFLDASPALLSRVPAFNDLRDLQNPAFQKRLNGFFKVNSNPQLQPKANPHPAGAAPKRYEPENLDQGRVSPKDSEDDPEAGEEADPRHPKPEIRSRPTKPGASDNPRTPTVPPTKEESKKPPAGTVK